MKIGDWQAAKLWGVEPETLLNILNADADVREKVATQLGTLTFYVRYMEGGFQIR